MHIYLILINNNIAIQIIKINKPMKINHDDMKNKYFTTQQK